LIERDEDARAHVRPFILTPSSGAADAQEKGQYAGPVNRVLRGQCPRRGHNWDTVDPGAPLDGCHRQVRRVQPPRLRPTVRAGLSRSLTEEGCLSKSTWAC